MRISQSCLALGFILVQVLEADFFLANAKDAFMENARQFLFETYCRIHQVRGAAPLAWLVQPAFLFEAPCCCLRSAVAEVVAAADLPLVACSWGSRTARCLRGGAGAV